MDLVVEVVRVQDRQLATPLRVLQAETRGNQRVEDKNKVQVMSGIIKGTPN